MFGMGALGKDAYSFGGLDHRHRPPSAARREDPVDWKTPRRFHHQEKECYLLLSPCYLHPHQHHPNITVYSV